jgi:hypothetical protein
MRFGDKKFQREVGKKEHVPFSHALINLQDITHWGEVM